MLLLKDVFLRLRKFNSWSIILPNEIVETELKVTYGNVVFFLRNFVKLVGQNKGHNKASCAKHANLLTHTLI